MVRYDILYNIMDHLWTPGGPSHYTLCQLHLSLFKITLSRLLNSFTTMSFMRYNNTIMWKKQSNIQLIHFIGLKEGASSRNKFRYHQSRSCQITKTAATVSKLELALASKNQCPHPLPTPNFHGPRRLGESTSNTIGGTIGVLAPSFPYPVMVRLFRGLFFKCQMCLYI